MNKQPNKHKEILKASLLSAVILSIAVLGAKAEQLSGGLTLLETSAARATSLGEAFSPVSNDIAAFSFNPGSLNTLKTGQASFLYEKGLADDSFGHFLIGSPTPKGSIGLSVGYYDGGELELFDGTSNRTVVAQRDLVMSLGYAKEIRGLSVGFAGKYLSSELAETASARAFAMDAGVNVPMTSNMTLGFAIQNIGTKLKYENEGDNLPRIARTGMAISMPFKYSTLLLLEAPYFMNEQEWRPAAGLEVSFGILALRTGYKSGNDLREFSIGTGFLIGRSNIDYSYGLVEELDSEHRVTFSMRFGEGRDRVQLIRKKKEKREEFVTAPKRRHKLYNRSDVKRVQIQKKRSRRVYKVRKGDTLGRISLKHYGRRNMWRSIYQANRHLINSPTDIKVGQKIIIP